MIKMYLFSCNCLWHDMSLAFKKSHYLILKLIFNTVKRPAMEFDPTVNTVKFLWPDGNGVPLTIFTKVPEELHSGQPRNNPR